ncbi:unnamed protein product [Tetraodon nigroviridis]|uniref:(spotted green pufferfish) hypothetical protein n=1 Tax=Tetraodon nigroviridis TaxID=99883 RepID=Q4SI01_TETNG|nr:unnamed protein product [Tetraodon nigroviridis]
MEHPTHMYLPLNEQPDHFKNFNDWQCEIHKLLIVLLKRMNNTLLAKGTPAWTMAAAHL